MFTLKFPAAGEDECNGDVTTVATNPDQRTCLSRRKHYDSSGELNRNAGGEGQLDKGTAEVILKSALSLGERINDLDRVVRDIKDFDERKRLLECLGVVMAELNAGIVLPIISRYPDMDPDGPT